MSANIFEYESFIREFENTHYKKLLFKPTIFEISKFPHYENVASNILAFYLSPTEVHGFGGLFLETLFFLLDEKTLDFKNQNVVVKREYRTQANGRIDIVVVGDDFTVAIENKIYHTLENDLNDYSNSISKIKSKGNFISKKHKVLLSKFKELPSAGFKNILYDDLLYEIESRIKLINHEHNKYFTYLRDFIQTHKSNHHMLNSDDKLFIEFLESNKDVASSFIESYNKTILTASSELNFKLINLFTAYDFQPSKPYSSENGTKVDLYYNKKTKFHFEWNVDIFGGVSIFYWFYDTELNSNFPDREFPVNSISKFEEVLSWVELKLKTIKGKSNE